MRKGKRGSYLLMGITHKFKKDNTKNKVAQLSMMTGNINTPTTRYMPCGIKLKCGAYNPDTSVGKPLKQIHTYRSGTTVGNFVPT